MIGKKFGSKKTVIIRDRITTEQNITKFNNEFIINKYLTLRLENNKTNIYVDDEYISGCKYLLLTVPTVELNLVDRIDSIDDAAEILDNSLEDYNNKCFITPEVEFWGHCSNLQAWAENDYNTRLLHRSLAFHLLRKLAEAGDPIARKVFKKEIIERFMSDSITVKMYLIEDRYLAYLDPEEIKYILINCRALLPPKYESYLQKSISDRWNEIALYYEYNRQSRRAFEIYTEILKLFPNDFRTLKRLGYWHWKKNQYLKAIYFYKKALELLQSNKVTLLELKQKPSICLNLGYMYYLNEDYEKTDYFCNLARNCINWKYFQYTEAIEFPRLRLRWSYFKIRCFMKNRISDFKKFIRNPIPRARSYYNLWILNKIKGEYWL